LISESEFIEGLVDLNINLNEFQIRQVFRELDKDQKGNLTFENFCGIVQKRTLRLDSLDGTTRPTSEYLDEIRSMRSLNTITSAKSRQLYARPLKSRFNEIASIYEMAEK